jgi:ethanolaminephosphotransferase
MYKEVIKNTRYNFIGKADEKHILAYKHNGDDQSLVYKHIFSPLADYSLQFTPLWVAPNLLTLLGFLCIFLP